MGPRRGAGELPVGEPLGEQGEADVVWRGDGLGSERRRFGVRATPPANGASLRRGARREIAWNTAKRRRLSPPSATKRA